MNTTHNIGRKVRSTERRKDSNGMKKISNIHEAISTEEKPTKEVEIFKN